MQIRRRIAAWASAAALAAGLVAIGAASPAQASDSRCTGSKVPPVGSICVHVYNHYTGAWTWRGPYWSCVDYQYGGIEQVTWVKSNQTGGVRTQYWTQQLRYLGSTPAWYSNRPPGYPDTWVGQIQVC